LEARNSYENLHTLSKEINYSIGLARALNGKGLIYLGRELYREALEEFDTALKVNQRIANQKNIAVNYLNIGICNQELDKWAEAYDAYKMSYEICILNDLKIYELMNLNRIGILFLEKEQLDSAEYYLLKVTQQDPNQWEKSYNLSGLTALETKKGNYTKAIEYGLKSFEISRTIGAKWDAAEVALKLSEAYEEIQSFEKALQYYKLHKIYSDSLLNEEMNREINWAELQQTKAENAQLTVQKNLLAAESESNRLVIILLASSVFFLIILAILFKRHLTQKEKYNQNLGIINRQLADKKLEIEKQNEDLKQINAAKNKLFSILSHDLRSPINSVKQLLDIRDSISPEDVSKYMQRLTKEVGKVNQQINRLLKWANTQMGGFKTHQQNILISKTVESNLESIQYVAEEKGIKLSHQPNDFYILFDPEQLNIIINNLLSNSVKYTSKGDSIKISYDQNDKSIFLRIEDTGIGMDKDTLAALNGEVHKLSYSRTGTDQETGTGLGILLVKQFLVFNQATMEIESEEGKGTCFILTFHKAINEI
jgi:signal transduction histidine kinase